MKSLIATLAVTFVGALFATSTARAWIYTYSDSYTLTDVSSITYDIEYDDAPPPWGTYDWDEGLVGATTVNVYDSSNNLVATTRYAVEFWGGGLTKDFDSDGPATVDVYDYVYNEGGFIYTYVTGLDYAETYTVEVEVEINIDDSWGGTGGWNYRHDLLGPLGAYSFTLYH